MALHFLDQPSRFDVPFAGALIALASGYLGVRLFKVRARFAEDKRAEQAPDPKAEEKAKREVREGGYDHDLVRVKCGGEVDFESIPEGAVTAQCTKGHLHDLKEIRKAMEDDMSGTVKVLVYGLESGLPLFTIALAVAFLGHRGHFADWDIEWEPLFAVLSVPFVIFRVIPLVLWPWTRTAKGD